MIVNGEPRWLTVPVASKGQYKALINEMQIADRSWASKHWVTLHHAYKKAKHFEDYAGLLQNAYEKVTDFDRLSEVNLALLRTASGILEISTPFTFSEDVPRVADNPTGRLVEICTARGASGYVSGPAARAYIDLAQFEAAGVSLYYANYSGYPAYDQGTKSFEHGVSMLDTLFHVGCRARDHLKSSRDRSSFLDPA